MGISLCDVIMMLKQQEKIGNVFFLKQNAFFYMKMYVWHFYPKCTRDYNVAFTIRILHAFARHYSNIKIPIKHGFLMHLHLLVPSGVISVLSGLGFNITLGVQQMSLHRKICLIPILQLSNVDKWKRANLCSFWSYTVRHKLSIASIVS